MWYLGYFGRNIRLPEWSIQSPWSIFSSKFLQDCMHQNLEFWRRRKLASIVSVNHLFESDIKLIGFDMILFRYDMIFLILIFQIHNLSILLLAVLINNVKKQVPQVSYKTVVGDLISFHSFGSVVNLFISDLISDMILFGSFFKIQ